MEPGTLDYLKCVIVGNGAVGKTSLLISYTSNEFPAEYIPTVFDNYSKIINVDNKFYTLGLWDTAGQEDYGRLRPLSYPGTDCILMCFGINSQCDFHCISQMWVPEIKHHCPNVPYFLIATMDDLRDANYDSYILVKGYLRQYDYIPIDVIDIIQQYSMNKKLNLVSDEDAEQLCEKIGAYKYMSCSALKIRGLKEIFEEVVRCSLAHRKYKHKRCQLL
eukprot:177541_1